MNSHKLNQAASLIHSKSTHNTTQKTSYHNEDNLIKDILSKALLPLVKSLVERNLKNKKSIKHFHFTNASGTSNQKCDCKSWLEHYNNYSKQPATRCAVVGCSEKATDGAHVRAFPSVANKEPLYILPLCHAHNKNRGWLQSKPKYKPVLAHIPSCS